MAVAAGGDVVAAAATAAGAAAPAHAAPAPDPPAAASDSAAHPTATGLRSLTDRLDAAEQLVAQNTYAAQIAADEALRRRTAELAAEHAVVLARTGLRQQLWRVTESGTPDPAAAVTVLPIAGRTDSASSAEGVGLLVAVQQRRLGQQRNSLAAARSATAHLHDLQVQAAAGRAAARRQAGQASLVADRARRLLAAAQAQADNDLANAAAAAAAAARAAAQAADRAAAQGADRAAARAAVQGQRAARAAADRTAARDAAAAHVAAARNEQVRLVAVQQRLNAVQQRLNAADASLVSAVSLVATGTGAPAVPSPDTPGAAAQAAVLRVLDATAPGAMPAGYHPSGQVVTGVGSWYGPGFIGSPTSSGTPYDPEQLTCAMLAVPLGTVVRVTTAAGRAVTVLVTDHGPYEPGRVVDLSMRANRVVDLELGAVRVDVLTAN